LNHDSRHSQSTRRRFLKQSTAAAAAAPLVPYFFSSTGVSSALAADAKNDRLVVGAIGCGSRAGSVVSQIMRYGDVVAVCDVDGERADKGKQRFGKGKADVHEDYRKILDRKDIEAVTIVTPDHWHTKIAIEAMQAGKDVYCEKPLTLTIEEGRQIAKVQKETGRVFQVGTQQRTEMGRRFLQAIALVRDGRIGKVERVVCNIGGSPTSGPIPAVDPPKRLNWEMWLGQTPLVEYRYKDNSKTNCHYQFRWWYAYSGGKLTDWGAHHVDIAQWAIEQNGPDQGPLEVVPVKAEHPVPLENGYPTEDDQFNTATKFQIDVQFPGVKMEIVSHSPDGNGILFEGTEGRFHVSRGRMKGAPVEELKENPLPEGLIEKIYKGKKPSSHVANFVECVKTREEPISDVHSHHRALTTCHLANIAIRLNRPLKWDPKKERIAGDDEANTWLARKQRKGYETNV